MDRGEARRAITNAYYETRNGGGTMETAADRAADAVVALAGDAVVLEPGAVVISPAGAAELAGLREEVELLRRWQAARIESNQFGGVTVIDVDATAGAWDEGFEAGATFRADPFAADPPRNPYRRGEPVDAELIAHADQLVESIGTTRCATEVDFTGVRERLAIPTDPDETDAWEAYESANLDRVAARLRAAYLRTERKSSSHTFYDLPEARKTKWRVMAVDERDVIAAEAVETFQSAVDGQ